MEKDFVWRVRPPCMDILRLRQLESQAAGGYFTIDIVVIKVIGGIRVRRRLVSVLLTVVMLLTMLPQQVFSVEVDTEAPIEEPAGDSIAATLLPKIPELDAEMEAESIVTIETETLSADPNFAETVANEDSVEKETISNESDMSVILQSTRETGTSHVEQLRSLKNTTDMRSEDGLIYTVLGDEVTITGCSEDLTELVIPEKINGLMITAIAERAFWNRNALTDVVIPPSVQKMGEGLFFTEYEDSEFIHANHGVLLHVSKGSAAEKYALSNAIPFALTDTDAVNYIAGGECGVEGSNIRWSLDADGILTIYGEGRMADYPCERAYSSNLAGTTSSNSVYNTAPWKDHLHEIQYVNIGRGITNVGDCAFYVEVHHDKYDTSELKTVILADTVTDIGESSFRNCCSLEKVALPVSLKSIGKGAFVNCSALARIGIPASVSNIEMDFDLRYAFPSFTVLAVYRGSYAYEYVYANNLRHSVIGENGEIYVSCGECGADGYDIYWHVNQDGVLTFEGNGRMQNYVYNSDYYYANTPWPSTQIKRIIIPSSIEYVGNYAFYGYNHYSANFPLLTDVVISEGVKVIGSYAFCGCKGLTELSLPQSLTSIYSDAFKECSGLTSLTLPNGLTSLGGEAFSSCTQLKEVTISGELTNIGVRSFSQCKGLELFRKALFRAVPP